MNSTALSASCKWNHMIIAFLWLPFYNLLYFPHSWYQELPKYSWCPFWKLSKDIYKGLFLGFLFYSISPSSIFIRILVLWLPSLCIICFRVKKYETPSFLSFQDCFGNFESLRFHMNFSMNFSVSAKSVLLFQSVDHLK